MMGKNKWRSYKHQKVNSWEATFKDPAMHDLSLIIAFLTGVLEAGERERVLMIKEEGGQFPYHKSMGISYAQHMNNVFEKYEKILPVYDSLYPVSRLCYYDIKGNLTEGDVCNMGDLIDEVVLREEMKNHEVPWVQASPLVVDSDYYRPSITYLSGGVIFRLKIYTHTDIWQPQTDSHEYDNLELAMCHTPRLNRFITEFKRLTLELGGEWEYGDVIPLP